MGTEMGHPGVGGPYGGPHLDIVHAHEVSAVVQILLQVTVLEHRAWLSPDLS